MASPRVITHLKRLRNVDSETGYLFRTLAVLKRKPGPVLFQFPKSFRADRQALHDFPDLIPENMSCAFEFRNPSWLTAGVPDLLRERFHSLCVADNDENPADEIISTAPRGYLRLRRSDYTDADLSQWVKRIL
jgi:uncharacterized protein YecE (DUF72 family)